MKIKSSGSICITFDDGPDPEATPEILRILKRAAIKATFFITGQNAESYPELVSFIAQEGHEIGEHGYNHLHPWRSLPIRYIYDLMNANKVIRKYKSYEKPVYFRPPYGKLNLITLLYIWFKSRHVAFWDIDPKDYQADSGEEVAKYIINNLISAGGGVILLHDGRTSNKGNLKITIDALNILLESIGDKIKNFSTIGDAVFGGIVRKI